MAKVIPIDTKIAKKALRGAVDFRQTRKWGVVAAKAKWPRKKKAKN